MKLNSKRVTIEFYLKYAFKLDACTQWMRNVVVDDVETNWISITYTNSPLVVFLQIYERAF